MGFLVGGRKESFPGNKNYKMKFGNVCAWLGDSVNGLMGVERFC